MTTTECEVYPWTCQQPAVLRYPALGGGYMHLCEEHGAPHARYCERWSGARWIAPEPQSQPEPTP